MGCNAWNHPPQCMCGWGGEVGATRFFQNALQWPTARGSLLNPNARCRKCGSSVFFYKSTNGGSVLFDSLGPPWPKHPCTIDNATDEIPTSAYWQANEILNRNFFNRMPLNLLVGNDTKLASWVLDKLLVQVRNGQFRPTVAMWISVLPPLAVGGSNLDLSKVNLVKVTSMANCVSQYFNISRRGRWQKVCLEVALAVLDLAAERDTARIAAIASKGSISDTSSSN